MGHVVRMWGKRNFVRDSGGETKGKRIKLERSNEVIVTHVTWEVVKLINLTQYDKRRETWSCIKVPRIYQLAEEVSAFEIQCSM